MLVALPYFSKKTVGKTTLITSLLGTLFLAGCSTTTYENKTFFENNQRNLFESLKKKPKTEIVTGKDEIGDLIKELPTHVEKVDNSTVGTVAVVATKPTKKAVEAFDILPGKLSKGQFGEESAACRYLRKSSDVEASIIGSPTVSASSDDDGSGSVSIGLNILDLRKAELVRATGDARCRMQTASKQIEATLGIGSEVTKFAANYAKQQHIRRNLGQLNAIKARANQMVANGIITKQHANLISLEISNLKAQMEVARAEADKRSDIPALDINQLRSRHGALIEATNDLQNIEREIRSNDALEVSVSTGYRYNNEFNTNLQADNNDGAFARVNVGIRLGALTAKRRQLEEEAAGARLDSLFEENTGTIWRSGFAERAISRMLVDLRKSEKQFKIALSQADDTINRLETAERAEVIITNLQTKVEKVAIGSELAAVQATIKQLEENRRKIRSLSK